MLDIDDWSEFEFYKRGEEPTDSGVYILMNDDEMIYIGVTSNLKKRDHVHSDSEYTGVFLLKGANKRIEDDLIDIYQPKYNGYSYLSDIILPLVKKNTELGLPSKTSWEYFEEADRLADEFNKLV